MSVVARSLAVAWSIAGLAVGGLTGFATAAHAIDIQRVVSPGGIEAWLVEDHSIQLMALSFAFVGGATQEPDDKHGVANFLAALLDEGAGDLDSRAYRARLEELAIGVSFDSGFDTIGGSIRTLSENRDEAVRLARLALTEPRFDPEPFERVRDRILTQMRSRELSPGRMGSRAMLDAVFAGHPYSRDSDGTPESVAALTVDDLRAFRNRIFARDNLKVGAVGDIDAATLGTLLDDLFGSLPIKANRVAVPEAAAFPPQRIDIASDSPQTSIRIVGRGMKRDDPDYLAAYVASYTIGSGTPGSRLYDEIREDRGLVYSVGLGLDTFDHGALVTASTSTRADQTDAVIALMLETIERFAKEGPTAEELADAKAYLIGSYPLRFVTSSQVARQLLGMQLEDLGIDYVERRNGLIEALTIEDIRAAAQRLFGSDDWVVVTVGPRPS